MNGREKKMSMKDEAGAQGALSSLDSELPRDIVETIQKVHALEPYIVGVNEKRKLYSKLLYEKEFGLLSRGLVYDDLEIRIEGWLRIKEIGEEGPKYEIDKDPAIVKLSGSSLTIRKEDGSFQNTINLGEVNVYNLIYLALLQRELKVFDLLEERIKEHDNSLATRLTFVKQLISLVEIAMGQRQGEEVQAAGVRV